MATQVNRHIKYEAIEGVPLEEGVQLRQRLPSRMLLTRKGDDDKARWTVGGHRAPDIGEYEPFAPTALGVGHFL